MSHLPLADSKAVHKIVEKVTALSVESIVIDKGIDQAKRDATKYAKEHSANFMIVNKLPQPIIALNESITTLLSKGRDIAGVDMVTHLDDFLEVQIIIIEEIKTDQDRKDSLEGLKDFLAIENPLMVNPLEGFNGVTEVFYHIWKIVEEEIQHISGILEKTGPDDLEKTIEQLKRELAPVKVNVRSLREALIAYAHRIN